MNTESVRFFDICQTHNWKLRDAHRRYADSIMDIAKEREALRVRELELEQKHLADIARINAEFQQAVKSLPFDETLAKLGGVE